MVEASKLDDRRNRDPIDQGIRKEPSQPKEKKVPRKKNSGEDLQEKVAYAWEISHDLNFVFLLEAENGKWTHDRRHPKVEGTIGTDYGFCGINSYWHPTIVKDKRFLTDWKWQMGECYRLYKGGTTFYGKKNIPKAKKNFIF